MATTDAQPIDIWHQRLGHANHQTIVQAIKHDSVSGVSLKGELMSPKFCEACVLGKQARSPIPASEKRAEQCGELIHFDICGPMSTESLARSRWLAVFVDDCSGYLFVYPMRAKSDISESMQEILVEAAVYNHRVRVVKSDNALELKSSKMKDLLNKHLVKQRFSTPYVPAEMGRVERQHRTVMESARAMVKAAGVPKTLWAEAAKAAGYIRNRVPLKRLDWKTPHEVWCGWKPSVAHLRVWGSLAYRVLHDNQLDKIDSRSEKRRLVGYDDSTKSYRLWLPGTRDVRIYRHVRSLERDPTQQITLDFGSSGSDLEQSEIQTPVTDQSESELPSSVPSECEVSSSASVLPKRTGSGRQAAKVAREKIRSSVQQELEEDDEWFEAENVFMCDVAFSTDECPSSFAEAMKAPGG